MKCCREGWWSSRCRDCCKDSDCTTVPSKPYCESGRCSANAPFGKSCANNPCQQGLTCCQPTKTCYECCNALDCPSFLTYYCKFNHCLKKSKQGSICFENY